MKKINTEKTINNINKKNSFEEIVKNKGRIFTNSFKNSKIDLWKKSYFMENYRTQEDFLNRLFKQYKSNTNKEDVFIKVKILDSFYSTNLKEGLDNMVSKIIKNKKFDIMLENGDLKLIDTIKKVKSTKHRTKDCISFASKYCSRYKELKFPIYDKYVKQMLVLINKATNFHDNFTINDIKNYKEYVKVVNAFIDEFNKDKVGKEQLNYKSFDRYIWTWAKEILNKIKNTNKNR